MSDQSTSLAKPEVTPANEVTVIPRADGVHPAQSLLPSHEQLQLVTTLAHMASLNPEMRNYNPNEGGVAKAQLTLLKGLSLGIPAIDALDHVYVVNGRTALSGQMMLRLIMVAWDQHHRGAGSPIEWDNNMDPNQGQRCRMRRSPKDEWSQWFEFTREKADAAGLLYFWKDGEKKETTTWKAYFVDMCRWRCIAAAAKIVFPDVIQGCYLKDELTSGIGLKHNAARSTDEKPPEDKRGGKNSKQQQQIRPLPKDHPKLKQISDLLDSVAQMWGQAGKKGLKEITQFRDDMRNRMLEVEFGKGKKPVYTEEAVDRMIEGLSDIEKRFAEQQNGENANTAAPQAEAPTEPANDQQPPPEPEGEKTE